MVFIRGIPPLENTSDSLADGKREIIETVYENLLGRSPYTPDTSLSPGSQNFFLLLRATSR